MPRNSNYRPTTVQYEPKKRQYGNTKLAETDSMEAIDMGPMMCECHLLNILCLKHCAYNMYLLKSIL